MSGKVGGTAPYRQFLRGDRIVATGMAEIGDDAPASATEGKIEFGILADHLGFHLRLANDRTFEAFTAILGEDRLRPGCFTMLILIAENPGITQMEVAKASGRDKSSVAKNLRYMEDKGLIRRERVEDDRRSSASFVTEDGAAHVRRLKEKAGLQDEKIQELLGPERTQDLISTLKELISKLA